MVQSADRKMIIDYQFFYVSVQLQIYNIQQIYKIIIIRKKMAIVDITQLMYNNNNSNRLGRF